MIRFWESEFDHIQPKKNKKGNRQYTANDIDDISLVFHLVKEKGFTLQGARDIIKNERSRASSNAEAIKSLEKVKHFLIELKNEL